MKLSIIIPTFNEERELPNLLKDIKMQKVDFEYEVIIADANSSDKTIEIAKQFGAIITHGGLPGIGRNKGAKIAKGELLIFFDSDIRLFNDSALQNFINEFEQRNLGVATANIVPRTNSWLEYFGHEVYNLIMRWQVNRRPYAPGSFIMAKKEIHNLINGFNEEIKLAEDHDYVARAGSIAKFGILENGEIYVSVRRLQKDGKFRIMLKYIVAAIHIELIGPITHNKFNYKFGYGNDDEEKEQ